MDTSTLLLPKFLLWIMEGPKLDIMSPNLADIPDYQETSFKYLSSPLLRVGPRNLYCYKASVSLVPFSPEILCFLYL